LLDQLYSEIYPPNDLQTFECIKQEQREGRADNPIIRLPLTIVLHATY